MDGPAGVKAAAGMEIAWAVSDVLLARITTHEPRVAGGYDTVVAAVAASGADQDLSRKANR